MHFYKSTAVLASLLAVSTLLSACGSDPAAPAPSQAPAMPLIDIAAEETAPPPPPADAYIGNYYNDYLHVTLSLDGYGAATFAGRDINLSGSYSVENEQLMLTFPGEEHTASFDADGDITIDGMTGLFLLDWDFWGITEAETGIQLAPGEEIDYQNLDLGDGMKRYRDFDNHIAFSYADGISVFTETLIGAAAATDGNGGFVSGRNVTDNYRIRTGSDNEFLEDYIKTFTFADFNAFYQSVTGFSDLQLLEEGIDGRIASATLNISSAEQTIAIKIILYTSTYPDGTVNYICKTVFAPADDAERISALSEAVTDMGAVRMLER